MSTLHLDPLDVAALEERDRPFPLPQAVERGAGVVLLALATPVIAASAFMIAALSRRSPFIAHLRVGQRGAPLWVLKLRTFWRNNEDTSAGWGWVERIIADPDDGAKTGPDPRITSRFAAFCRRHSIDELPQLWHVVRGEMSLVGPRPLTHGELKRHYRNHAAELLSVKPGLTGLWQVHGRSAVRFPHRAQMDLQLVRTLSVRLYLKILARTVPAVLRGRGAW